MNIVDSSLTPLDDDDDDDDDESFLWYSWPKKRRLALFPVGIIIRDPHHHEFPTRQEQDLNLRRICF